LKFESEEVSTAGGEVSIFRLPVEAEVQLIIDDEGELPLQHRIHMWRRFCSAIT
jgi:hypothetical protein